MTPQEIEAWAIRVADSVSDGVRVEDDRVECKAQWPSDHQKAARRIAGHANAARGVSILWLVGIDEDGGRVAGTDHVDLDSWWSQVERWFDDGVAPTVRAFYVQVSETANVAALYFETSRAPYVVKTSLSAVHREIPYRSATGVRSAFRHEILRMVVPAAHVPTLEILYATLSFKLIARPDGEEFVQVTGQGDLFIDTADRVMLPAHRALAWAHVRGLLGDINYPMMLDCRVSGAIDSHGIYVRPSGIYVNGPGTLPFQFFTGEPAPELFPAIKTADNCTLTLELGVANTDRIATATLESAGAGLTSNPRLVTWVYRDSDQGITRQFR